MRVVSLVAYVRGNPFSAHLFSDGEHYLRWAARIAAGEAPHEVFYQAPLYPYLLSLFVSFFGERLLPIYLFQLLLGIVSILLVWLIAIRFLPKPIAALSALLFAVHPYPIYLEQKLCPEAVALPLLLAALLAAMRSWESRRGWGLAGALSGIAAVAKANFLLFGAALFAGRVRRSAKESLAFFLPLLAVLLLPAARNYSVDGSFVPVAANAGEVFYHGNNPNARGSMGKIPGLPAEIGSLAERSRRLAAEERGRDLGAGEASLYWFRRGFSWIRENPIDFLLLELRKIRLLFSGNFIPLGNFFHWESGRFPGVPAFLRFVHYPLLALALLGVLHPAARTKTPKILYLYAMIPVATVLLFFVSTRYLIPLIPALSLLAGAALAGGLDKRGRITLALLAPFLVLLIAADERERRPRSTPFTQLASIRAAQGRSDEAVRLYEEALRLAPWEIRHYQNLAAEQERRGELAAAAATISSAVEKNLADGRTLGYYGALLSRLGRIEEAIGVLRRAVRIEPGRARTYRELGRALEASGRPEEAAAAYREAARLRDSKPGS